MIPLDVTPPLETSVALKTNFGLSHRSTQSADAACGGLILCLGVWKQVSPSDDRPTLVVV